MLECEYSICRQILVFLRLTCFMFRRWFCFCMPLLICIQWIKLNAKITTRKNKTPERNHWKFQETKSSNSNYIFDTLTLSLLLFFFDERIGVVCTALNSHENVLPLVTSYKYTSKVARVRFHLTYFFDIHSWMWTSWLLSRISSFLSCSIQQPLIHF